MENGKWLAALGGRKFVIAVLAMLLGTLVVKVPAEAQLEFLKWVVGLFAAGNVTQKAALAWLDPAKK